MSAVAIVGSARLTRDLAPFEDPDVEIWAMNESPMFPWMKRLDALFQMHRIGAVQRSNRMVPEYWQWLQQPHPFPIYMQHRFRAVPASKKYPYNEIMEELNPVRQFFRSSIAFALALAIFQKRERIALFGIDQASDTEYFWQRDCTTYWLGRAEGAGIQITLPDNCSLLRGKIYGYEGSDMLNRKFLEDRHNRLAELHELARDEVREATAHLVIITSMLESHPGDVALEEQFEKAIAQERSASVKVAQLDGALTENEAITAELDESLRADGYMPEEGKEY